MPTLVNDASVFPLWATDFLIIPILAAAMSSMDSVLLVAASTLYKNIGAVQRSVAELLGRTSVIGFSVLAALLALTRQAILWKSPSSQAASTRCAFPAVVFGLYWDRGSARAVLWSMIVGVSILIAWIAADLRQDLHEVFLPCFSQRSLITRSPKASNQVRFNQGGLSHLRRNPQAISSARRAK